MRLLLEYYVFDVSVQLTSVREKGLRLRCLHRRKEKERENANPSTAAAAAVCSTRNWMGSSAFHLERKGEREREQSGIPSFSRHTLSEGKEDTRQ